MPLAGLRASPPVSNVIPLPTNAYFLDFFFAATDFDGLYEIWRSRGGFLEPCPTAVIPPNPFVFNCASVSTESFNPEAPDFFTAFWIAFTKVSGVR